MVQNNLTVQDFARAGMDSGNASLQSEFLRVSGGRIAEPKPVAVEAVVRPLYDYNAPANEASALVKDQGTHQASYAEEARQNEKDFDRFEKDHMNGGEAFGVERPRGGFHQWGEQKPLAEAKLKPEDSSYQTLFVMENIKQQMLRLEQFEATRRLMDNAMQQIGQIMDQMDQNSTLIDNYDARWSGVKNVLDRYDDNGYFVEADLKSEAVQNYLKSYQERTGAGIID